MPGAMPPTEAVTAHHNGADFVKIFPAAALGAEGESVIEDAGHIDRGYEHFESKFTKLGANIVRVQEEETVVERKGIYDELSI